MFSALPNLEILFWAQWGVQSASFFRVFAFHGVLGPSKGMSNPSNKHALAISTSPSWATKNVFISQLVLLRHFHYTECLAPPIQPARCCRAFNDGRVPSTGEAGQQLLLAIAESVFLKKCFISCLLPLSTGCLEKKSFLVLWGLLDLGK